MKKAEIRRRVKTHIRERGEHADFDVTESFCLYWWHHLNSAAFNSQLTVPYRFEIRNFTKDCGWCRPWRANATTQPRRVVIGMNSSICDREAFLNILAHEMVHQWEWEIDMSRWRETDPDHGHSFLSWGDTLKRRVGLDLQITYDI